MERDIFICHASEDKANVVRPLAKALQNEEITCWVDEGEIRWGDSITQKVNDGLRISRFVIVVLSKSFLSKNWPKRELFAVLNLEASSGDVKALPLLVGDKADRELILKEFPLLNDKLYMVWDGQTGPIVEGVLTRLSKNRNETQEAKSSIRTTRASDDIPLPKIRKKFTQRDRDLFLKETFTVIRDYFRRALSHLETQYSEVNTDFTEIHAYKFIAKIYFLGETKNQCKIWIGGLSASDGIGYLENRFNIDGDNALNELVSIEDDGFELKLKIMFGMITQNPNKNYMTPSEVAETLWIRFTSPLEHR